jgi:hypothetical protein
MHASTFHTDLISIQRYFEFLIMNLATPKACTILLRVDPPKTSYLTTP